MTLHVLVNSISGFFQRVLYMHEVLQGINVAVHLGMHVRKLDGLVGQLFLKVKTCSSFIKQSLFKLQNFSL